MSIEDKIALQELIYSYAIHADRADYDAWANVFTRDAIFDERELDGELYVGFDAIRGFGDVMAEIVKYAVHHMSNFLFTDLTEATARGVVFALAEAELKSGYRMRVNIIYEDEYVKVDGAWKIAKRVLRKSLPLGVLSEAENS